MKGASWAFLLSHTAHAPTSQWSEAERKHLKELSEYAKDAVDSGWQWGDQEEAKEDCSPEGCARVIVEEFGIESFREGGLEGDALAIFELGLCGFEIGSSSMSQRFLMALSEYFEFLGG